MDIKKPRYLEKCRSRKNKSCMNRKSQSLRDLILSNYFMFIPFMCLCVGMSTHATDAQGDKRVCQVSQSWGYS